MNQSGDRNGNGYSFEEEEALVAVFVTGVLMAVSVYNLIC